MARLKVNLIKNASVLALCLAVVFSSAIDCDATPIPVTVNEILYSGPTAGTPYLTQYWLDTAEYGVLDAFCVENANVNSTIPYELVSVPNTLAEVAEIASRYFDGSVLALSSINDQTEAKVSTQLAIWTKLGIITSYDASYGQRVTDIFSLVGTSSPPVLSSIYLAQSPIGGAPGPSQDYLVSVPDASIMFLLGPAILGLGILGRKKSKA